MWTISQDDLRRRQEDWSRQEYALLGAFAAGCVIFLFAFAYVLGFGRSEMQTADAGLIPPAMIGERLPIIPVPK
jgi:hypothetical protein